MSKLFYVVFISYEFVQRDLYGNFIYLFMYFLLMLGLHRFRNESLPDLAHAQYAAHVSRHQSNGVLTVFSVAMRLKRLHIRYYPPGNIHF